MKNVQRIGLIIISSVAGLIMLAGILYIFRKPLLSPVLRRAAENRIEEALGAGGDYRIGPIEGSYITELRVRNVSLTPPPDSGIEKILIENLVVNYNPLQFMGSSPVQAVESVFARGVLIRYNPGARTVKTRNDQNRNGGGLSEPGNLLLSILDQIPDNLPADVEGRIELVSEGAEHIIPISLRGNTGREIRIKADVPESISPWNLPTLALTTTPNSLILTSVEDETLGAMNRSTPDLRVSVSAEKRPGGEGTLSRVEFSFITEDIEVRFDATPRAITAVAAMTSDGTALIRSIIRKVAGGITTIGFGSINLQLDLETEPDAPPAFLEYLAENPVAGQEFLSGTGDIRARDWRYRDIPIGTANGALEWHNDLLTITNLRVDAEGIFSVSAASLTLDPRNNLSPVNLEQLDVDVVDLLRFMRMLQQDEVPFSDILGMGLETSFIPGLRMGTDTYAGRAVPLLVLAQEAPPELPFEDLPFSVSTGDIKIRNGKWIIGRFHAEAGTTFVLDVTNLTLDPAKKYAPTDLDAVSLQVKDAEALARVLLKREVPFLDLVSSVRLTARKNKDDLVLDLLRITGKDLTASAEGAFTLFSDPEGRPFVSFKFTTVEAATASISVTGSIAGSLNLTDWSGTAAAARLAGRIRPPGSKEGEEFSVLLGEGTEADWRGGSYSFKARHIAALGGTASVQVEQAGKLSAAFETRGIELPELSRLAAALTGDELELPSLSGTIDLSGSFNGILRPEGPETSAAPEFTIRIGTDSLTIDGKSGSVEITAAQDADGLRFGILNADMPDVGSITGKGLLPFTIGPAGFTIVSLQEADFSLQGNIRSLTTLLPDSLRGVIPESAPEFRIMIGNTPGVAEVFFRAITTSPYETGLTAGILPYNEFQVRAIIEGFTSGSWKSKIQVLTEQNTLLSGDITLRPGTGWTLENLVSRMLSSPIEGQARFFIPLERFSPLIPRIQNLTGTVEGSITSTGSVRNPVLTGNITIRESSVRLEADIPSIDALSASIDFQNNAFTINSFTGFLGHAPFSIDGFIDVSRDFRIQDADLRLTGKNILLARNPDLRVRADTAIRIIGDDGRLTVDGRVTVTDALYTKKIPLFGASSAPSTGKGLQFFSVRGPLGERTDLNIRIVADNTVVLDTNLYRGPFSIDMRLEGTAAVPLPSGRIFTDEGRVLLPFSTLEINDARVQFTENNPFEPSIDIRGQTTMQNYNLLVNVTGNYPALEVNVTASPPLPSDRALLLLTTGNSSFNLFSSEGAVGTTRTVGTYIGKELLQRLIGPSDPDESTFFDRLDISVGREISRAGRETITVEYRIGRNSPWYVIVERDRGDNFNAGIAWRLWFR